MKLNIYILSHPIIKIISNYITENNSKKNIDSYLLQEQKILGFLIFYESMRKWLNIEKLYLQNIKSVQELYIFNPQKSYFLITNFQQTYSMLEYIQQLIPQIKIYHVEKNINLNNELHNSINEKTHIVIFEKFLEENNILNYIYFLNKNCKIMITQMTILCFTCHNKILDKIGQKYPTLNIYTAKIIYN
uniref:Uracil phosphoribosyltransferase n=1 Tax=Callithamnion tetricum TaxID=193179 RepID=A0A4D6WMV7_9FLOR|nr:hypothetical protein [Callithamnion tetricum]